MREKLIAWRKRNPEKVRAISAAWHKRNPEKVRAISAAWRKSGNSRLSYKKYKQKYPLNYMNTLLGGTRINPYPEELLKIKQINLKIKHLLMERQ